jgi:hypothetical protein
MSEAEKALLDHYVSERLRVLRPLLAIEDGERHIDDDAVDRTDEFKAELEAHLEVIETALSELAL